MVTEVRIPVPPGRAGGTYQKLERKVGDYATVAVAAHLELAADGTIADAGIALTSVTPVNTKVDRGGGRCSSARQPSDELFAEAGELAAAAARAARRRARDRRSGSATSCASSPAAALAAAAAEAKRRS